MPAMLKQNEPVNVKANRLDYDGNELAGNLQRQRAPVADRDRRQADTIVLDDKTGNLHATTKRADGHDADAGDDPKDPTAKPAARRSRQGPGRHGSDKETQTQPTTTVAEELVYEDASTRPPTRRRRT